MVTNFEVPEDFREFDGGHTLSHTGSCCQEKFTQEFDEEYVNSIESGGSILLRFTCNDMALSVRFCLGQLTAPK